MVLACTGDQRPVKDDDDTDGPSDSDLCVGDDEEALVRCYGGECEIRLEITDQTSEMRDCLDAIGWDAGEWHIGSTSWLEIPWNCDEQTCVVDGLSGVYGCQQHCESSMYDELDVPAIIAGWEAQWAIDILPFAATECNAVPTPTIEAVSSSGCTGTQRETIAVAGDCGCMTSQEGLALDPDYMFIVDPLLSSISVYLNNTDNESFAVEGYLFVSTSPSGFMDGFVWGAGGSIGDYVFDSTSAWFDMNIAVSTSGSSFTVSTEQGSKVCAGGYDESEENIAVFDLAPEDVAVGSINHSAQTWELDYDVTHAFGQVTVTLAGQITTP